nr:MAG TPA: hypothetical protein [Caudoviricetes sp.]
MKQICFLTTVLLINFVIAFYNNWSLLNKTIVILLSISVIISCIFKLIPERKNNETQRNP